MIFYVVIFAFLLLTFSLLNLLRIRFYLCYSCLYIAPNSSAYSVSRTPLSRIFTNSLLSSNKILFFDQLSIMHPWLDSGSQISFNRTRGIVGGPDNIKIRLLFYRISILDEIGLVVNRTTWVEPYKLKVITQKISIFSYKQSSLALKINYKAFNTTASKPIKKLIKKLIKKTKQFLVSGKFCGKRHQVSGESTDYAARLTADNTRQAPSELRGASQSSWLK